MYSDFYKVNPTDQIWWIDHIGVIGEHLFSFDKKRIFNLFRDYPNALTREQKEIFDKENPYWKEFFSDREYKPAITNDEEWKIANISYEWHASGPRYENDLNGINVLHFIANISKSSKFLTFTRFFCGDKEGEEINIALSPSEAYYFFKTLSEKEKENPTVVNNNIVICDGFYWRVIFAFKDGKQKCLEGKWEPPNIEYIHEWIRKRVGHLMHREIPELVPPWLQMAKKTRNATGTFQQLKKRDELDLKVLKEKLKDANNKYDNCDYRDSFKIGITNDLKGEIFLEFIEETFPAKRYFKYDQHNTSQIDFSDIAESAINEIKSYTKNGNRTLKESIDIVVREDSYLKENKGLEWACELLAIGHYAELEKSLYPELLLEIAAAINLLDSDDVQKKFSIGKRALINAYAFGLCRTIGEQSEELVQFLIDDMKTFEDIDKALSNV